MKRTLALVLLATLIITACTPVSTPMPASSVTFLPTDTPAPTATFTSTPAPTATATATPTATPTPIPTIQVGDLTVPDPHFTNPELFDLTRPDAPIPQFVNAMRMAGIEITAVQVANEIHFESFGNFVIGSYTLTTENGATELLAVSYPILIGYRQTNGNFAWSGITLRELADRLDFQIGVLLLVDYRNQTTVPIEIREFNLGIITFSWTDHVKREGTIDFSWPDTQLRLAQRAGMDTKFMHIIFPQFTPSWISDFSQTQLEQFTEDVITKVMSHYSGKISQYVVVNEPYIIPYRPNDPFRNILGDGYILEAFRIARSANPSAVLIYNDSDNHLSNGMTTALTQRVVSNLKSEGLIDGVGVQMHLGSTSRLLTERDRDDLIRTLQAYDVPVYVTELDMDISSLSGTQESRMLRQAEMYRIVVDAILASGVCKSISFWGAVDKFSWPEVALGHENADPLLFDDNLNPKPAYYAVSSVLFEHLRKSIQPMSP